MAGRVSVECPVERYARDVARGEIVAGRLVRLACERHLRDLEHGQERGLKWVPEAADHAIRFFGFLRHSKGKWAGAVMELEPWQQFRVGSIFGWYKQDPETGNWVRRFTTAYNEVARKNGKSTESAGVGLYLLTADGEPGAEVYSAATKRDQAKIVWDEAARMVRKSPALSDRVQVLKANMSVLDTESKWEPLGADVDGMDGLNPHGSIIDELHAHRTREMWDVIESALGSREQPLTWVITTAGFDQNGICYEVRSFAIDVLEGKVEDEVGDTWFAYIATIDEGDRWDDEAVWIKANPNLGVSVRRDYLREKAEKARRIPAAQNNFLTKHLNVWTQQVTRWIDIDLWDEQKGIVDEDKLRGVACYGGLDLASVSDLVAWVMVFPWGDEGDLDVLARFWCPEARLHDRQNRYRDQYAAWKKQGLLYTTPGDAIDYGFVRKQIFEDAETFDLQDLNIDRLFQAHQLATELIDEGLNVLGMGQGFYSMAAPMKEFERLLLTRRIHHGGNGLLRWMAGNVAVKQDPAGCLKPDKAQSQGKIDGIVALVMAIDRMMRHETKKSVYESRGVRTL